MSLRGIIGVLFLVALMLVSIISWHALDFAFSAARLLNVDNSEAVTLGVMWGLVIVLLIAVAVLIDRYLVRPILDLRRMAKAVGNGVYGVRVEAIAETEIGDLQGTFNRMARQLALREKELKERETRFRLLFEQSPNAVVSFDVETLIFEDINSAAQSLYGYSRDEFRTLSLPEISDEPEKTKDAVRDLAEDRGPMRLQRRHRRKDGSVFDAEIFPGKFVSGDRIKSIAVIRDITETLRRERELRDSETRFHTIFEQANDGMLIVDVNTLRFVLTNPAIRSMLQYDEREFLRLTVGDIHPAAELARVMSYLEKQIAGELAVAPDIPVLRRDGSVFYADIHASPLELSGRRCVVGIFHDITYRKNAEAALAEARDRLESVLSATAEGIYAMDEDGCCIFANAACTTLLGFSKDELIGEHLHGLIHHTKSDGTPYPAQECKACVAFRDRVAVHEENELFWKKDGTSLQVSYSSQPLLRDDRVVGAVVSFEDITQKLKTEHDLRHAQKVDALGNLAGGIAHELNNLLLPIVSLTGMTANDLPEDSREKRRLVKVLEAAERAKNLVAQIMTFSRDSGDTEELEVLDLRNAVRSALDFAAIGLPSYISVDTNFDEREISVMADTEQIATMVINLMSNAADAIGGEVGRIAVSVDVVDPSVEDNAAHDKRSLAPRARLTVTDTGRGMDDETLSRVFDPFFTTKEVGLGIGLGLSVVYGIVERHDGTVSLSSTLGAGTTVEVYLPLVRGGDVTG